MSLTLYYHPLASFCHKVLIALYEKEVAFTPRLINLGEADDRAALQAIWPIGKFPVLHDEERGRVVPEGTIIIEYLDHHFTTGPAMIPRDWDRALDVRLWDRFFDNYVQGPMQQIVANHFQGGKGEMTAERTQLHTSYAMLETHLSGRTWVDGADFGMADCAAAPALFYANTIVAIPGAMPQLLAYFERLMARPSVQRVLLEARPYFSMYPFEQAIPARFR